MSIKFGSTGIGKLYLGSTVLAKGYLGSTLVYTNADAGLGDEHWGNVIFYSKFNGTDEATSANDLSIYDKTITMSGGAKIDDGVTLFGENTALRTTSSSHIVSTPDDATWPDDTETFTAEGWFYFPSSLPGSGEHLLMGQYKSEANQRQWTININDTNIIVYVPNPSDGSDAIISAAHGLSVDTWYHIALDRDGIDTWRLYIDGVMVDSATHGDLRNDATVAFTIGSQTDGSQSTSMRFANIRVTNGVARYASDSGFAKPTEAFPTSLSGTDDTSYDNPLGSGDRTSSIVGAASPSPGVGTMSRILDGNTSGSIIWFSSGSASGNTIQFDFGSPHFIDAARLYVDNTTTMGVWKWQRSDDASIWTDIGSSFTLGGSLKQVFTELANNTGKGRYYRMLGVSGSMSSTPNWYEIEFKVDA